MKKIYSLLLMLLTAVIGLSAQTTESAIQLNIDDAVKVNGEALTPDADGVCTFTVTADTKVSICDTDGISDITVEAGAANDAVYNLQGVKVGTRGEMNSLPAGLYISNGKKVVVKGTAIDI